MTPVRESVTTPYGSASFLCYPSRGNITEATWLLNGTNIEELFPLYGSDGSNNTVISARGYPRIVNEHGAQMGKEFVYSIYGNFDSLVLSFLPHVFSHTTIDCTARFTSGKTLRSNACVLKLQGRLDAPGTPTLKGKSLMLVQYGEASDLSGSGEGSAESGSGEAEARIPERNPLQAIQCSADSGRYTTGGLSAHDETDGEGLTIGWEAPFTLRFAIAAPDITYCVAVVFNPGFADDVDGLLLPERSTDPEDYDARFYWNRGYSTAPDNERFLMKDGEFLVHGVCGLGRPEVTLPNSIGLKEVVCDQLVVRVIPYNLAGQGQPVEAPLQAVLPTPLEAGATVEPLHFLNAWKMASSQYRFTQQPDGVLVHQSANDAILTPDQVDLIDGSFYFSSQTLEDSQPFSLIMLLEGVEPAVTEATTEAARTPSSTQLIVPVQPLPCINDVATCPEETCISPVAFVGSVISAVFAEAMIIAICWTQMRCQPADHTKMGL